METPITPKMNKRGGRRCNNKDESSPVKEPVEIEVPEKYAEQTKGVATVTLTLNKSEKKASQKTSECEAVEQKTETTPAWNYRAHREKNAERRLAYAKEMKREEEIKRKRDEEHLKVMRKKKEEVWRAWEAQKMSQLRQKRLQAEEKEMEEGFQRMKQYMENMILESDKEDDKRLAEFEARVTSISSSSFSSGSEPPKSLTGEKHPSPISMIVEKPPPMQAYRLPPPPPLYMPFFTPNMPHIQFPSYYPYPPNFRGY